MQNPSKNQIKKRRQPKTKQINEKYENMYKRCNIKTRRQPKTQNEQIHINKNINNVKRDEDSPPAEKMKIAKEDREDK